MRDEFLGDEFRRQALVGTEWLISEVDAVLEGKMEELTLAERRVINDAKERFGETLTKVLLSGLREEKPVQSRTFNIISEEPLEGAPRLRISTWEPAGLPIGKEPLVLLTFLRPNKIGEIGSEKEPAFGINLPGMFERLDWEVNERTLKTINLAVYKYYHLSYEIIVDEPERQVTGDLRFRSRAVRLITNYDFHSNEDKGIDSYAAFFSFFGVSFRVMTEISSRHFLGIDWDRVKT